MILDLVLPVEEAGESSAKNATGFLNNIEINPSIHPPIHIVGISSYKDQVEEYAKRKGMDLTVIERWLSPVLGYDN